MKNLKSAFEKEEVNIWKDHSVWNSGGKRNKKFRKVKIAKLTNENKRREKIRMTWD